MSWQPNEVTMGMTCVISAVDPSTGVEDAARGMFLEKRWHGLHFLLTGSASEGEFPLGFLLAGGEKLNKEDEDEERRIFSPAEVRHISNALHAVSDASLWGRFDSRRMREEGIYPEIWDDPESDLRDEYVMYFNQLKAFVSQASAKGQGVIVDIG